ncbi:MAG TPA: N-glycosylase/DNA lyase [Candidatus Goldiibacteriota bacterium]|nr:N-glycosylase/DNA lyase [Candidatus Goldiibacteriota bacterium]
MNPHIREIRKIYALKKKDFDRRIADFKAVWESRDPERVLHELIFCIFTPQSKAVNCWKCVEKIISSKLLISGKPSDFLRLKEINGVRFKNNKSRYAAAARDMFVSSGRITIVEKLSGLGNVFEMREWLVKNIKGYGYKEASHFLRNIGFTDDIAILDRHILKNLKLMGVIREVPKTITPVKYLEIERKMKAFSGKIRIPLAALDLVLWYREAGHIFK